MEFIFLEQLLGLGVGGILGIIIFLMYRRDRKDTEKRWREMSRDLLRCRDAENITRDNHTKALTELTVLLRMMNGKGN